MEFYVLLLKPILISFSYHTFNKSRSDNRFLYHFGLDPLN